MTSKQLIGIGLRHPHYHQVLEELPDVDWLEVHSENFYYEGGAPLALLSAIRQHYPISLHGVGLSLGSADGLDQNHLRRLKQLIERINPFLVSEHISWSTIGGSYLPDLFPIPYNDQSYKILSANISIAQDYLGLELLIENPSSYLEYKASDKEEVEFLVSLCKKTGAKLLLDVNNVFVSCSNHNWNPIHYINSIPRNIVKEIHLAGHSLKTLNADTILRIDTHDTVVCPEVWELYSLAINRFGLVPTLLEWDADLPQLDFLIQEAYKALAYSPANVKNCDYA